MKWRHLSFLLIILTANLAAVPLERETAQLAEKLSAQYRKDQDSSLRRYLAVLALEYDRADPGARQTAETSRGAGSCFSCPASISTA
jgi:hypothetical protein